MTTNPPSFEALFAKAFGRKPSEMSPHAYQLAIATERELPDLVAVPTGGGKTAAMVLGWLWRRFYHGNQAIRSATPRRLVLCLPMRSLVEQVRSETTGWLERLAQLASENGRPSWDADGIPVFTLMGGEIPEDWEAYPEREAVLIGTQDMLLSRALNRGFGMVPSQWPMSFGLINTDALWVMDEIQLMGTGRTTSAQLQRFFEGESEHMTVPARRTIWMSATLGVEGVKLPDSGRVEIDAPEWMRTPERREDSRKMVLQTLSAEERAAPEAGEPANRLQSVIHAAKPLTYRAKWDFRSPQLLSEILTNSENQLTVVIANTVARARALWEAIRASNPAAEVILLHSRFRPKDRAEELRKLEEPTPPSGRIVVSTQVLEAGIDIPNCARLFTEVAPWPSLVQRFGRLNRRGDQTAHAVIFEVPLDLAKVESAKKKDKREEALAQARSAAARPYDWEQLEEARTRVRNLKGNFPTLDQLPDAPMGRPEGPVLRRFHVEDVFDTDTDLSGGHTDVSRFIRGIEADRDVFVFWRNLDSKDPAPGDEVPFHPDEICRVSIYDLTEALGGKRAFRLSFDKKKRQELWTSVSILRDNLRVGDTLMLDRELGGYAEDRGWTGKAEHRPETVVGRAGDRRVWLRVESGQTEADLDGKITGRGGKERDQRSFAKSWMTLEKHLDDAGKCAAKVCGGLVTPELLGRIEIAARWHDVGKAIERKSAFPFQDMLLSAGTPEDGHPKPAVFYAKSNGRGGTPSRLRHEVASALAYLAVEAPDDLVAYLIFAHHGKARLMAESWDADNTDACGVRREDRIPAEVLKGLDDATDPVCCDPEKLLSAKDWPSWQRRVARLLDEHGPRELAYLEALLRAIDWRAG